MWWRPSDGVGYVLLLNGDSPDDPQGLYDAEDELFAFGESL